MHGKSGNNFFNPMELMAKKGMGTLAYNDRWHLYDQLLFSKNWTQQNGLFFIMAGIYIIL